MTQKQKKDIDLLKDAVLFSVTLHCAFGNRKTVPKGKITSEAADSRTNATVKLIESPELDAIEKHLRATKDWCLGRCMPSFIYRGVNILKLSEAESVDAQIAAANRALKDELVPAFLAAYPGQIQDARK